MKFPKNLLLTVQEDLKLTELLSPGDFKLGIKGRFNKQLFLQNVKENMPTFYSFSFLFCIILQLCSERSQAAKM